MGQTCLCGRKHFIRLNCCIAVLLLFRSVFGHKRPPQSGLCVLLPPRSGMRGMQGAGEGAHCLLCENESWSPSLYSENGATIILGCTWLYCVDPGVDGQTVCGSFYSDFVGKVTKFNVAFSNLELVGNKWGNTNKPVSCNQDVGGSNSVALLVVCKGISDFLSCPMRVKTPPAL